MADDYKDYEMEYGNEFDTETLEEGEYLKDPEKELEAMGEDDYDETLGEYPSQEEEMYNQNPPVGEEPIDEPEFDPATPTEMISGIKTLRDSRADKSGIPNLLYRAGVQEDQIEQAGGDNRAYENMLRECLVARNAEMLEHVGKVFDEDRATLVDYMKVIGMPQEAIAKHEGKAFEDVDVDAIRKILNTSLLSKVKQDEKFLASLNSTDARSNDNQPEQRRAEDRYNISLAEYIDQFRAVPGMNHNDMREIIGIDNLDPNEYSNLNDGQLKQALRTTLHGIISERIDFQIKRLNRSNRDTLMDILDDLRVPVKNIERAANQSFDSISDTWLRNNIGSALSGRLKSIDMEYSADRGGRSQQPQGRNAQGNGNARQGNGNPRWYGNDNRQGNGNSRPYNGNSRQDNGGSRSYNDNSRANASRQDQRGQSDGNGANNFKEIKARDFNALYALTFSELLKPYAANHYYQLDESTLNILEENHSWLKDCAIRFKDIEMEKDFSHTNKMGMRKNRENADTEKEEFRKDDDEGGLSTSYERKMAGREYSTLSSDTRDLISTAQKAELLMERIAENGGRISYLDLERFSRYMSTLSQPVVNAIIHDTHSMEDSQKHLMAITNAMNAIVDANPEPFMMLRRLTMKYSTGRTLEELDGNLIVNAHTNSSEDLALMKGLETVPQDENDPLAVRTLTPDGSLELVRRVSSPEMSDLGVMKVIGQSLKGSNTMSMQMEGSDMQNMAIACRNVSKYYTKWPDGFAVREPNCLTITKQVVPEDFNKLNDFLDQNKGKFGKLVLGGFTKLDIDTGDQPFKIDAPLMEAISNNPELHLKSYMCDGSLEFSDDSVRDEFSSKVTRMTRPAKSILINSEGGRTGNRNDDTLEVLRDIFNNKEASPMELEHKIKELRVHKQRLYSGGMESLLPTEAMKFNKPYIEAVRTMGELHAGAYKLWQSQKSPLIATSFNLSFKQSNPPSTAKLRKYEGTGFPYSKPVVTKGIGKNQEENRVSINPFQEAHIGNMVELLFEADYFRNRLSALPIDYIADEVPEKMKLVCDIDELRRKQDQTFKNVKKDLESFLSMSGEEIEKKMLNAIGNTPMDANKSGWFNTDNANFKEFFDAARIKLDTAFQMVMAEIMNESPEVKSGILTEFEKSKPAKFSAGITGMGTREPKYDAEKKCTFIPLPNEWEKSPALVFTVLSGMPASSALDEAIPEGRDDIYYENMSVNAGSFRMNMKNAILMTDSKKNISGAIEKYEVMKGILNHIASYQATMGTLPSSKYVEIMSSLNKDVKLNFAATYRQKFEQMKSLYDSMYKKDEIDSPAVLQNYADLGKAYAYEMVRALAYNLMNKTEHDTNGVFGHMNGKSPIQWSREEMDAVLNNEPEDMSGSARYSLSLIAMGLIESGLSKIRSDIQYSASKAADKTVWRSLEETDKKGDTRLYLLTKSMIPFATTQSMDEAFGRVLSDYGISQKINDYRGVEDSDKNGSRMYADVLINKLVDVRNKEHKLETAGADKLMARVQQVPAMAKDIENHEDGSQRTASDMVNAHYHMLDKLRDDVRSYICLTDEQKAQKKEIAEATVNDILQNYPDKVSDGLKGTLQEIVDFWNEPTMPKMMETVKLIETAKPIAPLTKANLGLFSRKRAIEADTAAIEEKFSDMQDHIEDIRNLDGFVPAEIRTRLQVSLADMFSWTNDCSQVLIEKMRQDSRLPNMQQDKDGREFNFQMVNGIHSILESLGEASNEVFGEKIVDIIQNMGRCGDYHNLEFNIPHALRVNMVQAGGKTVHAQARDLDGVGEESYPDEGTTLNPRNKDLNKTLMTVTNNNSMFSGYFKPLAEDYVCLKDPLDKSSNQWILSHDSRSMSETKYSWLTSANNLLNGKTQMPADVEKNGSMHDRIQSCQMKIKENMENLTAADVNERRRAYENIDMNVRTIKKTLAGRGRK